MSSCAKCNKLFSGDYIVVCNVCNNLFHSSSEPSENCSGLAPSEIKALNLKSKESFLFYKCESCRSDGKDNPVFRLLSSLDEKMKSFDSLKDDFYKFTSNKLPAMEGEISDLADKYTKLSDAVSNLGSLSNSLNATSVHSSHLTRQTNTFQEIREYNLRQSKQNNVLLFHLAETIHDNNYDHHKDVENVIKVLGTLVFKSTLDINNVTRIGKFTKGVNRPVLIKFSCRSDALKLITNWKTLPRSIYVSFDYTPNQRSKYRILKEEVKQFNLDKNNNTTYKVIRYKDGEPFIMVKNKLSKQMDSQSVSPKNLQC